MAVIIYQALYRKWRSLTFDDVVGQNHITDTLKSQIKLNKLSHAYLFTGTRGTGKTSCAKILSRAVNCENPIDGEPCNKCSSCLGILSEQITDVSEIDAASNSRVDDVRSMLEEVVYTPASVKLRIYIIDEVHMLSTSAFNALLKTLEEPPKHVLFILATTEVHKLPATILSRCQRFDFRRISQYDIAQRLLKISNAEGIPLAKDGADIISRLGDGSMRDSLSILERCASTGTELDKHSVADILGLAGEEYATKIMLAVAHQDIYAALSAFAECYHSGREATSLIDEFCVLTRDLLIIKTSTSEPSELLDVRYSKDSLTQIAQTVDTRRVLYIMRLLSEFTARLRQSQDKRLEAEMCIMSICQPEPVAVQTTQAKPIVKEVKAPPPSQASSTSPKKAPSAKSANSGKEDISYKWNDILNQARGQLSRVALAELSICTIRVYPNEICIYSNGAMTSDVIKLAEKTIIADAAEKATGELFKVCIINENPDAQTINTDLENSLSVAQQNGIRVELS